LGNLGSWFSHTLWPSLSSFLDGFVHSEITAVAPIAQQAVANLTAAEAEALATGNNANTGHILAKVVSDTTKQLSVAGITAGAPSILAAIGAAAQAAPAAK
jgi:hypothetical protein